ncbi:MAG: PAS domain S-box protein [Bacteroidetes bacterium]|jgi:PAS domain S-box-containing protein|nr:PAS domain S-box protein [Bacteroidota bacterium]
MEFCTRNEQARLAALRRYAVMDTPSEEAFDRLVQMASRTLGVPVALMTLVDADRQWAKAKVGIEASEIPRDVAFCHHNLADENVLVVPDLTADVRFADNPYVASEPGLRFYAGAPLCTPDGFVLGSICVLDTAPRTLTADEVATLEDLATLAVEELERRSLHSYRRGLLESMTDAFVAVDTNWRYTYVNARAEALLQRDRAALLGRSLWEEFPPEAVPTHYEHLQEAVATQATAQYEAYVAPLDRWMEVSAYPFDGGLSIYFDDITEQRAQAKEVEQKRNLLEQTQQLAGAWQVALTTGETLWTSKLFDIFEYSGAEAPPLDEALLFYREPYRTEIANALATCRNEGTPFDLELLVETAQGNRRWVRAVGAAVAYEQQPDGTSCVTQLAGALQDITERKEMEQALRQREDDLREAQRIARLGSWTWDLQTDAATWSAVIYDIFGLPPEAEVTYETFISHVHPGDRARVRTFEAEIRGSEGSDDGEIDYRFVRPDGEVCFIRERSELIRAPDGTPLRVVGTAQDVTEETQRNAELMRAKEEAEQMNRLKSRFLANMSHEIRTPLTSIIGFAEILKEMELQGPVAECVDTIYGSSERLFTTLTSVLDLSQLEAGTLALRPEELVVQDVVADAVSAHDRPAAQQGIALDCILPPFDVQATLDRSACMRILSNIIGNAVKFTPEGRVDVTLTATDGTLTIVVADTGIGIDEGFLPSLFDPFKQESNGDTRRYEGNGLGMAITKDLVDLMGGTIHVETQKGEGTSVTVRLPRVLKA